VITVAFDLRGSAPANGATEPTPLNDAANNRSAVPSGYGPTGVAVLAAAILLLAVMCVTRIRRRAAR
jgi:hypothetical protein